MLIRNARMFTPEGTFEKLDVSFDERIRQTGQPGGPADIDAEGRYLIPGLIDLHTHGAVGCDFSDGSADGMARLGEYYASHGVTSFCATLMTLPEETLTAAVTRVRDHKRGEREARCAGIYLEGPFLSDAKRGAQAAASLHEPDAALFHRLNAASGGRVRLVGVAPELPGAMAFIREVSRACTVSLAHTAADYDTAMLGYQNGATVTTHLFNGMNPMHHREPAVIGAAFDSGAYAELICDGIHIHPSVVRMAFQLFGPRLILVSDSLRCAGMPEGRYDLGGQVFTVKDGKATLDNGTLAGSSIHLLQAVQRAIAFGIPPAAAIAAATLTPARAIGMDADIGSLAVGCRADMLLLDSQFNLVSTIINGKVINHEVSGI